MSTNDLGRLADGFLASARDYPLRHALFVGNRYYSYAELEDTARRWASVLVTGAERPLERVGVFAHRSATSYTGVLAALFAGATFVPLNKTFPTARTRAMIERADLDAIIVDDASLPQLVEVVLGLPRVPRLLLPTTDERPALVGCHIVGKSVLAGAAPLAELPRPAAETPAYLLFTSGSTGQPKGVPVTHANATYFMAWNQARYRLTPCDRLTQMFDQTFDLSVFDLFMAWNAGACSYVPQSLEILSPFRFVQKHAITVWFSVPSIAALLRKKQLLAPNSFPSLRYSLFCGEALPRAVAQDWQAAAPNSQLDNLYGPTELTIACSVYRWDPAASPAACVNDVVPIGALYDGLHGLIVDDALRPVAPGEPGELCVAGPQTCPGYFRDATNTAERFFDLGELRYYRTGDRVQDAGGTLVYLGRADSQVKIRGYRIELGEVEAALSRQSGVAMAAAIPWPLAEGVAEGLAAFVLGTRVHGDELRSALQQALPPYMVPSTIHVLDEMPLNANGKVDRRTLREYLARVA